MKKLLVVCSLVVMLIGVTAFNAAALQFTGDISFSGGVTPKDSGGFATYNYLNAIQLTFPSLAVITAVDGQYAGLPTYTQIVTFNTVTYNPVTVPITPLWTFVNGSLTYSFGATSMTVSDWSANSIKLVGVGSASITGFDASPGTWLITGNSAGQTASFSSSAAVVPEPSTLLLMGSGLLSLFGLLALRKKLTG